jgi:hypothetical protein
MEVDPAQQLEHYRGELKRAENTLKAAEERVFALTQIVSGLERLVGDTPEQATSSDSPTMTEPGMVTRSRRRRGRTSLKAVLADVMADGQRRDLDAILEAVAESGVFEEPPKRVSFTNRLNDLIREGYLYSPKRGEYELVSSAEAEGNADEPTGPNRGANSAAEDQGRGADHSPPPAPTGYGATAGAAGET